MLGLLIDIAKGYTQFEFAKPEVIASLKLFKAPTRYQLCDDSHFLSLSTLRHGSAALGSFEAIKFLLKWFVASMLAAKLRELHEISTLSEFIANENQVDFISSLNLFSAVCLFFSAKCRNDREFASCLQQSSMPSCIGNIRAQLDLIKIGIQSKSSTLSANGGSGSSSCSIVVFIIDTAIDNCAGIDKS